VGHTGYEKGKNFKTQSGVRCHTSNKILNNEKIMNIENFNAELANIVLIMVKQTVISRP
jgi:hypothetical protein